MHEKKLQCCGYTFIDFKKIKYLVQIQEIIKKSFLCSPLDIHKKLMTNDELLTYVKQTKDRIIEKQLIKKFLLDNATLLINLLGPDIDVQSDIHLRISRPDSENDLIDWHRDTFYGNSYWELNLWFPVFSLSKGAGLMVIEGSHQTPSNNIHVINEHNDFRKKVTKGSLANQLGYVYLPKADDIILNRDPAKVKLLKPKVGQAVLFFGYMAHRAQNISQKTRISIDLRIKNMLSPTHTKAGYYEPLTRSVITRCVEKMILINS